MNGSTQSVGACDGIWRPEFALSTVRADGGAIGARTVQALLERFASGNQVKDYPVRLA
jgi:hypothetical protein